MEDEIKVKGKKEFKILGCKPDDIVIYFTIYSVFGFIVETLYGVITKGTLESRQGFLYGPFCPIYGVGALAMILLLKNFNKSKVKLFLGGFIVGSIVEYILSLIGELIFNLKWWDYSDRPFNINGRICLYFSLFWGILAVFFMSFFHPKVIRIIDRIKKKISPKLYKTIIIAVFIFLLIDWALTAYALEAFNVRKVHEYNINVANRESIELEYKKIYENKILSKVINTLFTDKKMIKTFPNLKIEDIDGNILYFDAMVGDITPYYYKFK